MLFWQSPDGGEKCQLRYSVMTLLAHFGRTRGSPDAARARRGSLGGDLTAAPSTGVALDRRE
jgi:hypothetical protein